MIARRIMAGFLLAVGVYAGGYVWFRNAHVEVWNESGRPYVIFPKGNPIAYYLFRPLTYVDGRITGMGFHIGPHAGSAGNQAN